MQTACWWTFLLHAPAMEGRDEGDHLNSGYQPAAQCQAHWPLSSNAGLGRCAGVRAAAATAASPPPGACKVDRARRSIIPSTPSSQSSRITLRARQLLTRFPRTMPAAACARTLPFKQRAQSYRAAAGALRVQVCSRRRGAGASTPSAPWHLRPRASIQATSHPLVCIF